MEILNVTLNPDDKGSGNTLSNSNLTVRNTASTGIRATHGKSSGKWYWEVRFDSGANALAIGVSNIIYDLLKWNSESIFWKSWYLGYKYPEQIKYGLSLVTSDIIGVALDLDNGTLEFYKNGVSMGISHTNVKDLGEVYPTLVSGSNNGITATINFGATPFVYNVPNDFYSYNTNVVHKILISSKDETYSIVPEAYATDTAIPKMTSNTTPSGRAFASSEYESSQGAWRAFNRSSGAFVSGYGSGGIGDVGYEFVSPIRIGKYAVMSYNGSNFDAPPKDWTFEGSNDGVNWVVLDKQTNQVWTTINTDKEYFIDIGKINNYKMYRLNWTANNGYASYTIIEELKLYEVITPSKLLILPNNSEKTFINHGMNKDTSIDLTTSKILEREYIVQDNTQLGSGKVFKQKIDITRIRIRNAVIE